MGSVAAFEHAHGHHHHQHSSLLRSSSTWSLQLTHFSFLVLYAGWKFLAHPLPLADLDESSGTALASAIVRSNLTGLPCPFAMEPRFVTCVSAEMNSHPALLSSALFGPILPPLRSDDTQLDRRRRLVLGGAGKMDLFLAERIKALRDYVKHILSNIQHEDPLYSLARVSVPMLHLISAQLFAAGGWIDELMAALLRPNNSAEQLVSLRHAAGVLVTLAIWGVACRTDSLIITGGNRQHQAVSLGRVQLNFGLLVMALMFGSKAAGLTTDENMTFNAEAVEKDDPTRPPRLYRGNVAHELLFLHSLFLGGVLEMTLAACNRRLTLLGAVERECREKREAAIEERRKNEACKRVERRLKQLILLAVALFSMVASLAALVLVISDYEGVLPIWHKAVLALGALPPFLHSWLFTFRLLRFASTGETDSGMENKGEKMKMLPGSRLENAIDSATSHLQSFFLLTAMLYALVEHERVLLVTAAFAPLKGLLLDAREMKNRNRKLIKYA